MLPLRLEDATMTRCIIGLIVTLALVMSLAPVVAMAQLRGQIPQIGVLDPSPRQRPAPCLPAFQQGLRDLGYVEGQNLRIDYRHAEGHPDRLPALAAELVQRTPDVLWLHSNPAAWAAKRATTTIPIVTAVSNEPVEEGLVASLARPGGNLTGLELRTSEVVGKRLELLKAAVPPIARVAVLSDPAEPVFAGAPTPLAREAQALGVALQRVEAGDPATFEAVFTAMVDGGADALLIMESALFAAHRPQLFALALRHRLPTMAYGRHYAEAGSLMSYGADARELCQRSALFIHKILHGAKPADLPIERATLQFVINLKTAQALDLTIPASLLFQADEVIR
jgi:putative tryptophan/tyrosine transport system substrate-binding protein